MVEALEIRMREVEPRDTALGPAVYVKLHADGYRPLSWREAWEAFAARYPGRWAVQCFPPRDQIVDGKAIYHLFVLEQEPRGMNINTLGGRAA